MIVLAATDGGTFAVDLDEGEVVAADPFDPAPAPRLNLPRVLAAAEAGSTVVAVVDARPPMLVSHDAGMTWRESGRGLPPGKAVAIADGRPRHPRRTRRATGSTSRGTAACSGLR